MKYIKVPASVSFDFLPADAKTGKAQTLSFADFVRKNVILDASVSRDHASIETFIAIAEACAGVAEGDIVELSNEQHEMLSDVVRKLNISNPDVKLQVLYLMRAVTGAASKDPRVKGDG